MEQEKQNKWEANAGGRSVSGVQKAGGFSFKGLWDAYCKDISVVAYKNRNKAGLLQEDGDIQKRPRDRVAVKKRGAKR